MSEKTKYLRSVTAQLQQKRTSLAKLRADVCTRRQVSVAERAQLKTLQSGIRKIRSNLAELAAARHDEWPDVQAKLDQRLQALEIPSASDLSRMAEPGVIDQESA